MLALARVPVLALMFVQGFGVETDIRNTHLKASITGYRDIRLDNHKMYHKHRAAV